MTFLPILERELRIRARTGATYWTRFAVALVGVLVCVPPFLATGSFAAPTSVGKTVFDGVITAAFLMSCGACLLTADVISAERREGTLALLFLTRVKTLDVMAGKLGSIGLSSLCVLGVFLPMLMVPVLAGGVTGGEAFRMGLALLNTLFFALACGLWASAWNEDRFEAGRAALLALLGWLAVPWLLDVMFLRPPLPFLRLLSPFTAIYYSGDLSYRSSAAPFWISLAVVHAMAWYLLIRAGTGLRRVARGEEAAVVTAPRDADGPAVTLEQRRPWQVGKAGASPVQWLVRRQRGLRATLWGAALTGALFQIAWSLFYPFFGFGGFRSGWFLFGQLPGLAFSILSGALLAWAASRFFVEARRTGELELLLTTPACAGTIVSEQWRALKHLLRWPVVVMLAAVVVRMLGPMTFMRGNVRYGGYGYIVASLLLYVANVLLAIGAVCWLGLWFGLKARGQAQAIAWAVGLAKGVPFLISSLYSALYSTFIFGLSPSRVAARTLFSNVVVYWLPQLAVLAFYVWLIRRAKRRLEGALAGVEPMSFSLRQSVANAALDTVAVVRQARHWTPPA